MIGLILTVFIVGWATEGLTLFDIGRYSFPLIFFAAIPFCLRFSIGKSGFLVWTAISTVFAILVAAMDGVETTHIVSQSALQFLAIAFAGGVASINWRLHLDALAKALVGLGIPIVLYAGYQMVARALYLPFAYLPITNKQYYVDNGLQLAWNKPGEYTRASSIFSEPSELAFYCLWLIVIGFSYKTGVVRTLALALGCAGLLFSQSLSGVIGLAVLVLVYIVTHRISARTITHLTGMAVIAAAAIGLMNRLVPEAFERLTERVTQAATLDDRADSGRVDHLPACWMVITDAPVWGHGISSLQGSTDSSGSDSTTINYVMLLMERGVIGTTLYFIPWFLIAAKAWLLPKDAPGRSTALLLMVMTLTAYCNFSITYFLPFWLAFGIAASLTSADGSEVAVASRITARSAPAALSSGY